MEIRVGTDYRSVNGMPVDGTAAKSEGGFQAVLGGIIDQANQAEMADQASNIDLSNGIDIADLSATMIAAEKAELSLRLAVQVRNKVVDAYNEIMRMQV